MIFLFSLTSGYLGTETIDLLKKFSCPEFCLRDNQKHREAFNESPCSGHGFKHSAAIGEALAEQVVDGKSKIDISSFSLKRFKHLIR
jgi:hypothetical protein